VHSFRLTEILHGTSALGGDRFNNRFSKRREEILFFPKINKNKNPTPQNSKLPVSLVTHF
jgi:hypothetical protein